MTALLELPADNAETDRTPAQLDRDEIERRAYFHYLDRGRADGFAFDDWIAAETELRQESTLAPTATR
jgi:Protein of unknown function (DUF2934)